jgi:hypothetical protein
MLIASTHRTFSSEAAASFLRYAPRVSMSDALARTLASYPHLRANTNGTEVAKAGGKAKSG